MTTDRRPPLQPPLHQALPQRDAHAAACQAAGRTAGQMQEVPWGSVWTPERESIEHDTSLSAAQPDAALTPDERLTLLAAFASLA